MSGEEVRREKALELLRRICSDLESIPAEVLTESGENREEGALLCACCLLPLEKGEMFISMPCCGAICHIPCVAKIATIHRTMMHHACPHCLKEMEIEDEQLYIRIYNEIKQ